jgi:putative transposase
MKEQLGYKYRIYPDEQQERLFRRTVGSCRFVYNLFLEQKKLERGRSDPRRLTQIDQIKQIPEAKLHFPFLKEVPSHCLQQAVIDLHKAYANFFKGNAKYPKPRRKFQNESFRFPDPLQLKFREGAIFLPKTGWLKLILHRQFFGAVKNVTVSVNGDHWYVSVQTELEVEDPIDLAANPDAVELGGDLGVVNALVLSDGTVFDLPQMTDDEKRREGALSKKVSRKKKGSRNRLRAQRKLRQFKAKIARRRRDAKHKMTTDVVRRCDVIYLEDLKLRNMTASAKGTVDEPGRNVAQKAGLNRSILDVSPGETRLQLEYKMRRKGGAVILVNPAFTSQRCAECGHTDAANRPERDTFVCVSCDHAACADANASANILYMGRKSRTGGHPGLACGSNPVVGRKQEEDGSSRGAAKATA